MVTVREALMMGRKKLTEAGAENPVLDSELILGHVLAKDRLKLLTHDEENLTQQQIECYDKLLVQRCQSVPVAYIIGRKEFYGLNFYIKPGVLIPRPETEFVVEEALNVIRPIENPVIADLCFGSGAISVAIAVNHSRAKVYASDLSDIAWEVAKTNIKAHRVEDRVLLFRGDLWSPFECGNIGEFDVVVSNPPYIPTGELFTLPKDVKNEPQIALNGGPDGLEFYRRIVSKAPEFLKPCGRIILEIGWNQADNVKTLLKESEFGDIKVIKDYGSFDRVISGVI
jgi:release factor glutamine methyltransferase